MDNHKLRYIVRKILRNYFIDLDNEYYNPTVDKLIYYLTDFDERLKILFLKYRDNRSDLEISLLLYMDKSTMQYNDRKILDKLYEFLIEDGILSADEDIKSLKLFIE